MKRVTRNIDPAQAHGLLERVPRACIAFVSEHGPQAQPVAFRWRACRYLIGVAQADPSRPASGDEVVLLIDEGVHFFALRAIYVRGTVQPAETPDGAPTDHTWFEVVPLKTVAWDYGMLREVPDAHE